MKMGYHELRREGIRCLLISFLRERDKPGTIRSSCFFDRNRNNRKSSYNQKAPSYVIHLHQYPL